MAGLPPLSYSSLRTYQECPLRWKYLYVDRLPELPRPYFTFGRVIHAVLEELLRPLLRSVGPAAPSRAAGQFRLDQFAELGPALRVPSEDETLKLLDRYWRSEGYSSAAEEERYRALGRQILREFRRQLEADPPSPIAIEHYLEADWGGVRLRGYVDRIDATPSGGLAIVDYKTSRELDPREAETSDQLALYQVLVERNFPQPVESLSLVHLRTLTPQTVARRSERELGQLQERVEEVADGIRHEEFLPRPGRHCHWCDFRGICPEFRPLPEEERERLRSLVDRFEVLQHEAQRCDAELRAIAEELHRAAEQHGVHRVPGSRSTLLRRSESLWRVPLPSLPSAPPEADGLAPGAFVDLSADRLPPALRRRLGAAAERRRLWYWEREGDGRAGAAADEGRPRRSERS